MTNTLGRYKARLLNASVFAAFVGAILIGFVSVTPSRAQSSAQNATAAAPVFEYEVATIKTYKPGLGEGPNMIRMGIMNAPDAFSATGVTVKDLVQNAYGVQNYQVSGGPDWFGTERLEIDAKMDSAVADALKKLSTDDRALMRQKMLQALLADRFKLTIHRETKELAVYTLVIAKSGLKMQEAKPDSTPPDAAAARGGRGGRGGINMMGGAEGFTMTATAIPMTSLTRNLSQLLKRPVVDKTGLTGNYDVTLKFMTDEMAALVGSGAQMAVPGGSSSSGMAPAPTGDASFPTLLVAVQEQLGLKLEAGKGQAEFISVEHVEKASDN
jgi:uncharacterized protein (TIGR03435 family)